MTLPAQSVGYLVPRGNFAGRVHSVFANACNVAHRGALLTLLPASADDGPTTVRLAPGAITDFSQRFARDEPVIVRAGCATSPRAALSWTNAPIWRPTVRQGRLADDAIGRRVIDAGARLAAHRRLRSSVLDGAGAGVVAAFASACRDLDHAATAGCVDRLIGWGEGLTPSGDDFLVGALAALDALRARDASRNRFRRALARTILAGSHRTTPISAHLLRLAAGGHYAQSLLRLRDALASDERADDGERALDRALAIGASSGADTVTGLLHGLAAWLPPVRAAT